MSLLDLIFGAAPPATDEGLNFRRSFIRRLRGDEELFDALEETTATRSQVVRDLEERLRLNILAGQAMSAQRALLNEIVDQRRKLDHGLVEMVILQSNINNGRAWEKKWFDLGLPMD